MHKPYADLDYYLSVYAGTQDDPAAKLKEASRQIDTLTFNRIVGRFDTLTKFQQDIVKEVCCEQADFLATNEEMLQSAISSYSINGVSMTYGTGINLCVQSGVAMFSSTYAKLCQTGLCYRGGVK